MKQFSHSVSFSEMGDPVAQDTAAPVSQSLHMLRRHYSYLLNNLPGVVYRCEAAAPWKMQSISAKVVELTGRRREEFEKGLAWSEVIYPDDLEKVEGAVARAVRERRQFTITYRIVHTSGALKWIREQGQLAASGALGKLFLEGFLQDVTQEHDLELGIGEARADALSRSAALDAVLESTNDCVYSLNEQWLITYLNGRAREHFGTGTELIGERIEKIFPAPNPAVFESCLRRAMYKRVPGSAEGFLKAKGCWYELRAAPTPGGITVFFRDITQRRHLEELEKTAAERWRVTLSMIPQMVWSMSGASDRPDFYNERWYEFTGLPPGSLRGDGWAEVFHPDDRDSTLARWRASKATGEPYEAEYRVRNRAGEYRWVVSRGQAEFDAEGRIIRWYGTCTDVHERFLDQAALRASENRSVKILNSVPQVIWCANQQGALDFVSEQWAAFSGTPNDSLAGSGWRKLVYPKDRVPAFQRWMRSVRSGEPFEASFRIAQPDGNYLWTLVRATPERMHTGAGLRWFGTCTNIDEQVSAQKALADSDALNRGIIEASPDCISLLDEKGKIVLVNAATLEANGPTESQSLVGSHWGSSFDPFTRVKALRALEEAKAGSVGRLIMRGGPRRDRWYDVAIAPVAASAGKPRNLIVTSRDFTERKAAEEKAQWTANHDLLTGLPNRFLFNQRVEQELANAQTASGNFALLLFDVDHLKHINDALGHDAGDALLKEVAHRLSESVREMDTVSRWGGDEFAVLLPGIASKADVAALTERFREQLTIPFQYGGSLVDCHASIGASIWPMHGEDKNELMKSADIALYVAKKSARGHLRVFEQSMREQMQRRTSMLSLAKNALDRDLVRPYYQPKVQLSSGQVVGFEALLRWQDQTGSVQLPRMIEAAFEDVELAADISSRMMQMVLDDIAIWVRDRVPFGHVALNVGAIELRAHDFADVLLKSLEERSLASELVQLEITEKVFLGRGTEQIHEALRQLSLAGIKIALDDFGTGYASLSHLNKHPVDLIKIDRSFLVGVDEESRQAPIVDAILGLGRSLGIKVVAEGIETESQQEFLVRRGCEYAQGFLYSQAVPASQVGILIDGFSNAHTSAQQTTPWPKSARW